MSEQTINDLQDSALLLQGLCAVSDLYFYSETENDSAKYFILKMQKNLTEQLKKITDELK